MEYHSLFFNHLPVSFSFLLFSLLFFLLPLTYLCVLWNFKGKPLYFFFSSPSSSIWQLAFESGRIKVSNPRDMPWHGHTLASGWRSAASCLLTLPDLHNLKLHFSSPTERLHLTGNPTVCLIHISKFWTKAKDWYVLEIKWNGNTGVTYLLCVKGLMFWEIYWHTWEDQILMSRR